ncbi:hypothetical protein C809_00322, partial [Lachnospiraceae bacterium MD335]
LIETWDVLKCPVIVVYWVVYKRLIETWDVLKLYDALA